MGGTVRGRGGCLWLGGRAIRARQAENHKFWSTDLRCAGVGRGVSSYLRAGPHTRPIYGPYSKE